MTVARLKDWRARASAYRLSRRLVALLLGLAGYGLSLALLIRSSLGVNPWGVLQVALADRLHLSVGTVVMMVSVVVLLAWWPLHERPGFGTIANSLLVGLTCDAALALVPDVDNVAARVALLLGGVVGNGLSGALYIGAGLGPGPRDGLMTALHRITGRPLRRVRLTIELTVLIAGWLLGGPLGVGTAVYAVGVGVVIQWTLPKVRVQSRTAPVARTADEPVVGPACRS